MFEFAGGSPVAECAGGSPGALGSSIVGRCSRREFPERSAVADRCKSRGALARCRRELIGKLAVDLTIAVVSSTRSAALSPAAPHARTLETAAEASAASHSRLAHIRCEEVWRGCVFGSVVEVEIAWGMMHGCDGGGMAIVSRDASAVGVPAMRDT